MLNQPKCFLCDQDAVVLMQARPYNSQLCQCNRCGAFILTESLLLSQIRDLMLASEDNVRPKISAFTRAETISRKAYSSRKSIVVLTDHDNPVSGAVTLEYAIKAFPRTVAERLDKTLMNLSYMSGAPGIFVDVFNFDGPLAYVSDEQSLGFMLWQLEEQSLIYREQIQGFVRDFDKKPSMPPQIKVLLTANGWARVAELEQGHNAAKPYQAFVAMWFSPEVETAYDEGFYKGIITAGYDPVRIDREVHNNRIDDQIIAEIRKSRFVVADFTGARPGVYYEAGFAQGLGLEVIWCCREDWMDQLHFDTRQYPHIVWSTPENLHMQLKTRIEALIGPGVRREQP